MSFFRFSKLQIIQILDKYGVDTTKYVKEFETKRINIIPNT
jgi:hypothetical protein